jgi:uncharacterized protein YjiS (DUF1127 family)
MNEALMSFVNDPCTDSAALRARSATELWKMWLRVGWALLLRAAPPLSVWRQRAWERRMLAQMTERDLKDMRMTRHDAELESNKPFWKA